MEDYFLSLSLWEKSLACIFLGTFFIRLYHLFFVWGKGFQNDKSTPPTSSQLPGVSVIIPCCNRGADLARNLPSFLSQDYPDFQVVVVNNGSDDDTEEVLKVLSSQYPNLYYTTIPFDPVFVSNDKMAMTLGVKACKHDWVIFSYPDCTPSCDQWLRRFGEVMAQEPKVVFGPALLPSKSKEAKFMLRFSVLRDNINRMAWASVGKVYKACRYNVGYRKSCFFQEKGFADQLSYQGGDDDLFIQKIARKGEVRALWDHQAAVLKEDWVYRKEWNHYVEEFFSHFIHYQGGRKALLFSQFFLDIAQLTAIGGLLFSELAQWVLGLFLLEYICIAVVFFKLSKRVEQPNNFLSLWILELVYPIRRISLFIGWKLFRFR